jgi:Type ISP C-terminal specificity domain/Phage integrase family
MREKYLEMFDSVTVDNLNGDKYRTGKVAPDGTPDPSVFSTPYNREGIQVGTAVVTLVKTSNSANDASVQFRNLWGKGKLEELQSDAIKLEAGIGPIYESVTPPVELGFPFTPAQVGKGYLEWALLPEIFPVSFPGVKTSRDEFVTDIDRDQLEARMLKYFDKAVSHEEMGSICPGAVEVVSGFDGRKTRENFQKRGYKTDHLVRYLYKPFDARWIYWEAGESKLPNSNLLDRPRPEYFQNISDNNLWLEARQKHTLDYFDRGLATKILADNLGNGLSNYFPVYLERQVFLGTGEEIRERDPNLSTTAKKYLERLGCTPEDLFYHCLAIMHSAQYRTDNAGALRQDWPRVPQPEDANLLRSSAALGRQLAALLDPLAAVDGMTSGAIRPELRVIGTVSRTAAGQGTPDLAVKAHWGSYANGKTMPGKGKTTIREFTTEEMTALEDCNLGGQAVDIFLNAETFWRCVPLRVWEYTLGGYQVIKKWLSYREHGVLGRALLERHEASDFERRAAGAKWQEYDLVFGSSVGTPVWESSLRRIKTRIATLANVPDLSVHAVRYTYTSLAVLRGLDIKVVSERLGHSTIRMTQDVYQQVYNQQRRGAALSSDQLLGKSALNSDKLNGDKIPKKKTLGQKASGQKTSGKKTPDEKPVKRKKKPSRSDDETP